MSRLSEALEADVYFDGSTYASALDKTRLSGQLYSVALILSDRRWHTLSEIAKRIGGSEAGVSARIRDLRKERFGRHHIDRQRLGDGLWQYRMI